MLIGVRFVMDEYDLKDATKKEVEMDKRWKDATKKEIDNMQFEDAVEILQRHINLGKRKGDFRPREHLTKAMEIILNKAINS